MRKQWWKGIKRMIPGAVFGGVTVAGINLTVDLPMHEVQFEIDPVINLNCRLLTSQHRAGPARQPGRMAPLPRQGQALRLPGQAASGVSVVRSRASALFR